MKARKTPLPSHTLLRKYSDSSYSDCYSVEFTTDKNITPDEIILSFWIRRPQWVNCMFELRNILVKPFGLDKGNEKEEFMDSFKKCIETEQNFDYISVPMKSSNETVLCLDDKHLKAYLSVHIEEKGNNKIVSMTTVVQFKYWLGYAYFYAIAPFHCLIVKKMLTYTMKRIIQESK